MPDAAVFHSIRATAGQAVDGPFRPAAIRRPVFGRRPVPFAKAPQAKPRKPLFTTQDVKEFLMAYCACFMAVMGLIA